MFARIKKWIVPILLGMLLIAQFFPIDKSNPEVSPGEDFVQIAGPPAPIAKLMENACYDCHSHKTKYPWYTNIAPVAWWIAGHIDHGRSKLNFSQWAQYAPDEQADLLEECAEEINDRNMPLTPYIFLHPKAKLSDLQRDSLVHWLTNPVEKLTFETTSFARTAGNCEGSNSPCLNVKLDYHLAKGGADKIREVINDTILNYLIHALYYDTENPDQNSIERGFELLTLDFKTMLKEEGAMATGWSVEVEGKLSFPKPHIASVLLPTYSYLGGVHPNSYTAMMNFNTQTGALLTFDDLIKDTNAFKQLVEKKFKEAIQEKMEEEDVDMNDFFWGEGFRLPENFAITDTGLYLFYNTYEAAAYVFGPIDFTIPFEDLKTLLLSEQF